MSNRKTAEFSNLNMWQEPVINEKAEQKKTKKKKKSGIGIFSQAWDLVNSEREKIYPKKVTFLDYGDGYVFVEQNTGSITLSGGGEMDVVPSSKLVRSESNRQSLNEVPDNVRRLAMGIKRGSLNKKHKHDNNYTDLSQPNVEGDREVADEFVSRKLEGSTIVVYDGASHDQVYPRIGIDEVNRNNLIRMAKIVKNIINR